MLDRLLQSPVSAFAFIFFVVVLIMIYMAQRERGKVQQMRGMRRFTPGWSSGRRHGRRGAVMRGGFQPQWSGRSRRETSTASRDVPADDETDPDPSSKTDP